jgi:membrane protease YdiL (CAAX protease family)
MGDTTATWTGRWGLGSGKQIAHAIAISVLLVTHFIVGFGAAHAMGLPRDEFFGGSPRAILMGAIQGLWAWGLVIGVGLLVVGRVRLRQVGWHEPPRGRDVAFGLLGAAALLALVFGPLLVSGKLDAAALAQTIAGFSAAQRFEIFLIGLLAASTEETVFRGYLQTGLVARLGFPVGLLLGAVIFAVYHLPMGIPPLHLALKGVSGLVLGLLRGRDRTLWAPAIAHFLFWQIAGFA